MQKRKRLEEARQTTQSGNESILLADVSLRPAVEDQIIASFWDQYAASAGASTNNKPMWLESAIMMASPTDTLRQALLALSFTRTGRWRDDRPCVVQGQRCYGVTLKMMQQALYDPALARTDEILAAARCMVLCEAFETTTDSLVSWINQVRGMCRIIQLRQPEDFGEPFPRQALESMRQNAMIESVITRRTSFLGEQAWLTKPWRDATKSLEQQLYDYGFLLASLFKRADELEHLRAQAVCAKEYREIFETVAAVYRSLSSLNDKTIQLRENKEQSSHSTYSPVLPISLIGLDLNYALFADALLKNCPRAFVEKDRDVIEQFIGYTTLSRRRELSRQILRHVMVCAEREPKFVLSQLVFALNTARFELRSSEEDQPLIRAIFDQLENRNRHRLTGSLRKAGEAVMPPMIRTKKVLSTEIEALA